MAQRSFRILSCINRTEDEWLVSYWHIGRLMHHVMFSLRRPSNHEIQTELNEILGFF